MTGNSGSQGNTTSLALLAGAIIAIIYAYTQAGAIGAILAVILAAAALILHIWAKHMLHTHGLPRLAGNWILGRPLDGKRRCKGTHPTWTRPAECTRADCRVSRRHHLPEWRRTTARASTALTLTALLAGLAAARTATLTLLGAVAALMAAAWIWHVTWRIRNWALHGDIITPLTRSLTAAGVPALDIQIERNFDLARFELTPGFKTEDRDKVIATVTAGVPRLSIAGPPDVEWSRSRVLRRPVATFTKAIPMPHYVAWAEIKPVADVAAEHEMVLGLTRARLKAPFKISVDNDSPHVGLSMPSGDGKSVTARLAAAQLAHHGSLVVILDRKLTSHTWAAGLPNVAYARTIEEVHQLCLWLAAEVDRRNVLTVQYADIDGKVHVNPGARICALLEELNATQDELKAYWKSSGGKGQSPAVTALNKVAFTGRAVLVNLVYIGQRLSAKATGGGSADSRENLGLKAISNPTKATWNMLVGDRFAMPEGSDVKGRLHIIGSKTLTTIQCAYMTNQEAHDYAISGIIAQATDPDMPCLGPKKVLAPYNSPERALQDAAGDTEKLAWKLAASLVSDTDEDALQASDLGDVSDIGGSDANSETRLALAPPPLVTGDEAIAQGILPTWKDWKSAYKFIMRDPNGPRPVPEKKRGNAPLWNAIELEDYHERKRGNGQLPPEKEEAS